MDKKSNFKFIAGDLLKQDGKTIKDLADVLKKDGLSYRTIYEYFRRGGGSLEIGAKIARGMNRTLNDIYISSEKATPEISKLQIKNNIADEDLIMRILNVFIDFEDHASVSAASRKLGMAKLYDLAEMCNKKAEVIKSQKEIYKDGV